MKRDVSDSPRYTFLLPFGLNHGDLKLNPMWDDLRNDSRFDRILAESALPLATGG